jgi:hypothetical protein
MKFEIADWRFEVTWAGLLCQPIERGQAKAARKSSTRHERRKAANAPDRQAIGLTVRTIDKQAYRKGATK